MPALLLVATSLTLVAVAAAFQSSSKQKARAVKSQSLLGQVAANVAIPWELRQWASIVVPLAVENAPDVGMDPADLVALVFGHMSVESGGNPRAINQNRSSSGAVLSSDMGLMQINDRANPGYGATTSDPFDPGANIRWAIERVIVPNIQTFAGGDWPSRLARVGATPLAAAVAAYNAGAGGVMRVVGQGFHPDAATYSKNYSALVLSRARQFGFQGAGVFV